MQRDQSEKVTRKTFNIDEDEFSQSTFMGRIKNTLFYKGSDPRVVTVSKKQVKEAYELYDGFKEGKYDSTGVEIGKLVRAKRIVYTGTTKWDRSKIIPRLFRTSHLTWSNTLLVGIMNTFSNGYGQLIAGQLLNQGYNSAFNYYNRSREDYQKSDIIKNMGVAITSASAMAISMRFIADSVLKSASNSLLPKLIPFFSVVAANWVNVVMTRRHEATGGIDIWPDGEPGNFVGKSKICGKRGIYSCLSSRVAHAFVAMGMAQIVVVKGVEPRLGHLMKNPGANLAISLLVTFILQVCAVPIAYSLGNDIQKIKASKLEKEFHNVKGKDGKIVKYFKYNKGV